MSDEKQREEETPKRIIHTDPNLILIVDNTACFHGLKCKTCGAIETLQFPTYVSSERQYPAGAFARWARWGKHVYCPKCVQGMPERG